MTPEEQLDHRLREHYAAARVADAREAPAFADVLARARAASAGRGTALGDATPARVVAAARTSRRWRWALAAAPLAMAAGLAIVWLAPRRSADDEFERLVSEWSRTERTLSTPTDKLLAVPGSEFLRPLPTMGADAGAPRSRS